MSSEVHTFPLSTLRERAAENPEFVLEVERDRVILHFRIALDEDDLKIQVEEVDSPIVVIPKLRVVK